jgi:pimeloyl-ACP methyl ester carboxylesterase
VNLFRKVGDLTKRPFDWSADVSKIQVRTLLVYADADSIRPEHMVEFWKTLGGGQRDAGIDGLLRTTNQLAIVPNTTHYTVAVDPMLPEIVERFLATE